MLIYYYYYYFLIKKPLINCSGTGLKGESETHIDITDIKLSAYQHVLIGL